MEKGSLKYNESLFSSSTLMKSSECQLNSYQRHHVKPRLNDDPASHSSSLEPNNGPFESNSEKHSSHSLKGHSPTYSMERIIVTNILKKGEEVKPKILLRFHSSSKNIENAPKTKDKVVDAAAADKREEEEPVLKPWNLRPKGNSVVKRLISEIEGPSFHKKKTPVVLSTPSTSTPVKKAKAKAKNVSTTAPAKATNGEKKRKFTISLRAEEIAEDFLEMFGTLPSRRPNKRPRHIQKVLNNLMPCRRLIGTTADTYYRSY